MYLYGKLRNRLRKLYAQQFNVDHNLTCTVTLAVEDLQHEKRTIPMTL